MKNSLDSHLEFAPTTRYQGSKRKMLPWIWSHLEKLEFESVLDAFGGTGCVSYMFKCQGKQVDYNDLLKWNHINAVALLENDGTKLTESDIDFLTATPSSEHQGVVSEVFKNIYFTKSENLWIDAVAQRLSLLQGSNRERRLKKSIAFYALSQTCLVKRPFNMFHRVNLNIRTRNVARTFGNKTTWDRSFKSHFKKFVAEIQDAAFTNSAKCRSLNHEVGMIPSSDYDLLYLDPPYLRVGKKVETADYFKCYHFLEGLASYQTWSSKIDHTKHTRPLRNSMDNPWIDVNRNLAALEALICRFPKSKVAISYKKHGAPSIASIGNLLKRHGKKVTIHSRHYKYALNAQNGTAAANRECLVIGE